MSHPADRNRAREALRKAARAYAKAWTFMVHNDAGDAAVAIAEQELEAAAEAFAEVPRCSYDFQGNRCQLQDGHPAYPSASAINGHYFGDAVAASNLRQLRKAAKKPAK